MNIEGYLARIMNKSSPVGGQCFYDLVYFNELGSLGYGGEPGYEGEHDCSGRAEPINLKYIVSVRLI